MVGSGAVIAAPRTLNLDLAPVPQFAIEPRPDVGIEREEARGICQRFTIGRQVRL